MVNKKGKNKHAGGEALKESTLNQPKVGKGQGNNAKQGGGKDASVGTQGANPLTGDLVNQLGGLSGLLGQIGALGGAGGAGGGDLSGALMNMFADSDLLKKWSTLFNQEETQVDLESFSKTTSNVMESLTEMENLLGLIDKGKFNELPEIEAPQVPKEIQTKVEEVKTAQEAKKKPAKNSQKELYSF